MSAEHDSHAIEVAGDVETELIDLTGMTLDDLRGIDQSSLGQALRRVLARREEPADPVVAFQSGI